MWKTKLLAFTTQPPNAHGSPFGVPCWFFASGETPPAEIPLNARLPLHWSSRIPSFRPPWKFKSALGYVWGQICFGWPGPPQPRPWSRDPSIRSLGLATELQFVEPIPGRTSGWFLIRLCAVCQISGCSSAQIATNPNRGSDVWWHRQTGLSSFRLAGVESFLFIVV